MTKPTKSQWNFGELFPAAATRKVLSVSELTTQVRRLLEKEIGATWVTGEVTNLRAQSSGHIYFSLKDAAAQLQCVLFRGEAAAQRALLEDGRKVILRGDLTVYEARGQYQLRVTAVELQGVGALQLAFEQLKQKLNAEGLFAAGRKRPLPRFPQTLGVVTSATGAALRDVLHVIQRRQPGLEIILAPCRVQGQGAGQEIAAAIRALNEFSAAPASAWRARSPALDLILVTRGGGSLEDLWAFNEEVVARAIFESALPVVSAVGHEIDFTISDFVADLRAATPSAAAELITEGAFASRQFVQDAPGVLSRRMRQRLAERGDELGAFAERLQRAHPRRRLEEQGQRLDELHVDLWRSARANWRERQAAWLGLSQRLHRLKPGTTLAHRRTELEQARRRLSERTSFHWLRVTTRLTEAAERLRLLSPASVLERGYSITRDATSGRIIRSATEARPGQRLTTLLKNGEVRSVVESE